MKKMKKNKIKVEGKGFNGVDLLNVINFLCWLGYEVEVVYSMGFKEWYEDGILKGGSNE